MKAVKKTLLLAGTAFLLLTACGQNSGFNTQVASLTPGGDDQNPFDGGGSESDNWEKVSEFEGIGTGHYTDERLIRIDKANQAIVLLIPFPIFFQTSIIPVTLPDLPGVTITSQTGQDGFPVVAISIPLKYISKQAQFSANEKLPNGQDLPYFPEGEGAGFAVNFPGFQNAKAHIYIGVGAAAAFIEVPGFSIPFSLPVVKIKNRNQSKDVGGIGVIGTIPPHAGGLYLAAQLPSEIATLIDELVQW